MWAEERLDLKKLGLERLPDAIEIEARERLEALKKRRFVDLSIAAELKSRGWRQATEVDGLLWCSGCNGPTV
jgi:hypothetical protein